MDNQKELSKIDRNVLNRLCIPENQKALLEKYWQKNLPTTSTGNVSISGIFIECVRLLMIGVFALLYFVSIPVLFIDIALVALWIFNFVLIIIYLGTIAVLSACVRYDEDDIMDRAFVCFLPGGSLFFTRIYSTLTWAVIFGLMYLEEHFITAGMIALCWIGTWVLNKTGSVIILKFLRKRADEPLGGRIARDLLSRVM